MRKLTVLLGVSFIALVTATSPAAARSQFTCNGGYQFVTVGDLVVPPSGTCLISLSTVEGNVTVMKGGYIRASATQIGGNVKGHDALRVYLDGATRVTGDVEVKGTKETILVDSQFGDVRVQGTPNGGGDIHFFNNSIAFYLLIVVPLFTMRLLAEERRLGTIELLYTYPLRDREILEIAKREASAVVAGAVTRPLRQHLCRSLLRLTRLPGFS